MLPMLQKDEDVDVQNDARGRGSVLCVDTVMILVIVTAVVCGVLLVTILLSLLFVGLTQYWKTVIRHVVLSCRSTTPLC